MGRERIVTGREGGGEGVLIRREGARDGDGRIIGRETEVEGGGEIATFIYLFSRFCVTLIIVKHSVFAKSGRSEDPSSVVIVVVASHHHHQHQRRHQDTAAAVLMIMLTEEGGVSGGGLAAGGGGGAHLVSTPSQPGRLCQGEGWRVFGQPLRLG